MNNGGILSIYLKSATDINWLVGGNFYEAGFAFLGRSSQDGIAANR
jgi:hypothetical protein